MRHHVPSALLRAVCCTILSLLLAQGALAAEGTPPPAPKHGILLVAFGTSVPEAVQAIDAIKRQAEAAFPGVPVRLAYSSHIIRDKIAGEGIKKSSPAQALADMAAEGFTHVAVQSLQSIPGREYTDVKATAEAFQAMPKGIAHVSVGRPLLSLPQDIDAAAAALLPTLPTHGKGEAVVLMGHGTEHLANAAYSALQLALWKRDANVFVATVESTPSVDDLIPQLKRLGVRTAYLVPFMSVAGDHAHNDMAGKEHDSWASKLAAAGIAPKPVLVGLGSRPAVSRLWIEHLKDADRELGL
jgi:sirohydrochlorin cobaltochelatase